MKLIAFNLLARADQGARIAVIAAAGLMVTVVSAQVVLRYLFNSSLDWAEEVSRLAFLCTVFLAIPLGIRDGTHVSIELVVSRLPMIPAIWLRRTTNALAGAMLLIVAWATVAIAAATWSERLGAINVTSSVFFFPVIIGAVHSALHLLHLAIWPADEMK